MGNTETEATLDGYTPAEVRRGLDKLQADIDATPAAPASPRPWTMNMWGFSGSRRFGVIFDANGVAVATGVFEEDAKLILAAVQFYDATGEAHDSMCETDR